MSYMLYVPNELRSISFDTLNAIVNRLHLQSPRFRLQVWCLYTKISSCDLTRIVQAKNCHFRSKMADFVAAKVATWCGK